MKKMIIASLAAAGVLLAVANQAHAGATLDAVKKKVLCSVGSVTGCLAFLMPMQAVSSQELMSTYVVALPPPYLAMIAK